MSSNTITERSSGEATEDNELSFHENDRIVRVEAVSEDWWEGELVHGGRDGVRGLFPANFVQVQE